MSLRPGPALLAACIVVGRVATISVAGVTDQLLISGTPPHISYVTLMHGFLTLSFLSMCATVIVNLAVGAANDRGNHALGDRSDRRCRWLFPSRTSTSA